MNRFLNKQADFQGVLPNGQMENIDLNSPLGLQYAKLNELGQTVRDEQNQLRKIEKMNSYKERVGAAAGVLGGGGLTLAATMPLLVKKRPGKVGGFLHENAETLGITGSAVGGYAGGTAMKALLNRKHEDVEENFRETNIRPAYQKYDEADQAFHDNVVDAGYLYTTKQADDHTQNLTKEAGNQMNRFLSKQANEEVYRALQLAEDRNDARVEMAKAEAEHQRRLMDQGETVGGFGALGGIAGGVGGYVVPQLALRNHPRAANVTGLLGAGVGALTGAGVSSYLADKVDWGFVEPHMKEEYEPARQNLDRVEREFDERMQEKEASTNRFLSKVAKKVDTSRSPYDLNVNEILGIPDNGNAPAPKPKKSKGALIAGGVGAAGAAAYGAKKLHDNRQEKQASTNRFLSKVAEERDSNFFESSVAANRSLGMNDPQSMTASVISGGMLGTGLTGLATESYKQANPDRFNPGLRARANLNMSEFVEDGKVIGRIKDWSRALPIEEARVKNLNRGMNGLIGAGAAAGAAGMGYLTNQYNSELERQENLAKQASTNRFLSKVAEENKDRGMFETAVAENLADGIDSKDSVASGIFAGGLLTGAPAAAIAGGYRDKNWERFDPIMRTMKRVNEGDVIGTAADWDRALPKEQARVRRMNGGLGAGVGAAAAAGATGMGYLAHKYNQELERQQNMAKQASTNRFLN